MRKTFQYRLYPTKAQRRLLIQTLDECRWVYNQTLALRKTTWETEQQSVSLYQTNAHLVQWKTERPSLNTVHSQILQQVQVRVDLAYKAFFRRVKAGQTPGYPRFKGKGWYDSFTYPQFGFAIKDGRLKLSKIGTIQMVQHRPLEGMVKTCTIRRKNDKWFVSVSCDDVPTISLPPSDKAVGIDLGLSSFATLSTGKKIANPRFFRSEHDALTQAQQRLSKATKGTPERAKRRKVVARIHERLSNKRLDFAHQLSCQLVKHHGTLVFEDLNIQDMLNNGNRHLNRSMSDAAWRQLIQYTTYKAANAGRRVVLVDPRNTSKLCSRCGQLVEKTLSDRVHACHACGLRLDRDHNAAINILRVGLHSLP